MSQQFAGQIPPLQGCLYCHSEGTISLTASRKWWHFGGKYPLLKCSYCNSMALLDYDPRDADNWRICFRHVNHASRYYYVDLHMGRAGWLPAQRALAISRDGYVQRKRVTQAKTGDLEWLQPAPANQYPTGMDMDESVYLNLKGVTLQTTPPAGLFNWSNQGTVLDSGKFYATEHALYLLGQRHDWTHSLENIWKVTYDQKFWTVFLVGDGQQQQYRGVNAVDQWDAQLVSAVIESLWLGPEMIRKT